MFDLESFINTYVTKRPSSMFEADIGSNTDALSDVISGRSVLVIGGAGSIGSSFIRAILHFQPAELVVVDTNENALTELTRSIRSSLSLSSSIPAVYLPYPMDYSSVTFRRMFHHHTRANGLRGFDIVANFSAHKHVRSEKDIYSVEAMIRNIVINARSLLEILEENSPETYFCVSTDKAANPVNIMGASKRIMEDLIFSYSDVYPVKTARFANVAFSNGSLPAGFLERISQHQDLEYDSVKVIITRDIDEMITHNIFYTAITRSKQYLKIFWSPETMQNVISSFETMNDKNEANIFLHKVG